MPDTRDLWKIVFHEDIMSESTVSTNIRKLKDGENLACVRDRKKPVFLELKGKC